MTDAERLIVADLVRAAERMIDVSNYPNRHEPRCPCNICSALAALAQAVANARQPKRRKKG